MNDINNTILPERALSGCRVAWPVLLSIARVCQKGPFIAVLSLCCSCSSSNPLLPKAQLWGTYRFCSVIMRRLEQAVVSHPWCEDDMCSSAGSAYRFRHVRVMGDEMTHHWSLKNRVQGERQGFPNVHMLLHGAEGMLWASLSSLPRTLRPRVSPLLGPVCPPASRGPNSAGCPHPSFLPHAVFIICCRMKLMPFLFVKLLLLSSESLRTFKKIYLF